jgi:hypothetical protein
MVVLFVSGQWKALNGLSVTEQSHSVLDELDTLPTEKACDVWNKVIARNRKQSALGNSVAVTTTPEGYRFVYETWHKNKPNDDYIIYKAKTRTIHLLPAGYVESLELLTQVICCKRT